MAFPQDFAPQTDAGIGASIRFGFVDQRFANAGGNIADKDYGHLFHKVRFKGMANGGYIVKFTLFDSEMALLPRLIQNNYFKFARKTPVAISFQLFRQPKTSPNSGSGSDSIDNRRKSTKPQTAIIFDVVVKGRGTSKSRVEIVAVDPPSWFLNTGDASGEAFTGNVSGVMEQVIDRYSKVQSSIFPGGMRHEITKTKDAKSNKWYMMRQDPKTFIASLMEWSSPLTPQQTHWLVSMDGNPLNGGPHIAIKEQADHVSRQRGYYTFREKGPTQISTILSWNLLANNALTVAQAKIVSQGVSMLTGEYFDRTTDKAENEVYVTDQNTTNKRIANVEDWQSTSKPNAGVSARVAPGIGMTSVPSIPDVYSAGDLGLEYREYVGGRARGLYLGMLNNLLKMKITVQGHGEWSDTFGLGIDTVFLNWTKEPADGEPFYFAAGNWLIFGFEHIATRQGWFTDLWVARWDYNAEAVSVP